MNAIKADFPSAIASDLSFLPAKLYGEHWAVAENTSMKGKPDFYQITLKEGKESYRAVYDKEGNLLSSKFIIPQAKLPAEVMKTISEKYPEWKVTTDTEKIVHKKSEYKAIYRVTIEQNKAHRMLEIADGGKLIKDKK
jgi:hypothetical protein